MNCILGQTVLLIDQKGIPGTSLRSRQLHLDVTIGIIFPEMYFPQEINTCGTVKLHCPSLNFKLGFLHIITDWHLFICFPFISVACQCV